MIDPLQTALIAGSLLLAGLAAVYVALDRLTDRFLLAVLAILELGLIAQAVVGIAQVASDNPGVDAVVFVGYLLGALMFLPAATFWALGEPTRSGTAALVVVGLVVPVLIVRIEQIWTAPGV